MKNFKCAVLGATGVAGQQFIEACSGHPWFTISGLYASEKSAGKKYCDACTWHQESEIEPRLASMVVKDVAKIEGDLAHYDIIFSALPGEIAREAEEKCAKQKPVISTTSAFRYDEDVPILIPEVNAEHAKLIERQKERGWKGFVVPGPNCTTVGLAVSLKPIYDEFGIKNVFMTSMQALSGAGYPGVPSLDIVDNIVPYIAKEEDKVQKETVKILGAPRGKDVKAAAFAVSCTCTRANVRDGHTETVFVETEKPCSPEDYRAAVGRFNERMKKEFGDLPSAPKMSIIVRDEENRPQPRRDRDAGGGMSTTVGRIRKDDVFRNGIKYVVLSHNTKKGAAKGEILVAEYLVKKGYIK
ncbi:Aspartate-semialdehyde dehydrogenase [uncultured archaeon]|nr:Aspartate-semialdehyde dehydrogenase [uncultured archaeon]